MSEKEFEKIQLTKLISDLRDINSYTSFKNGAYIYDLGYYQGLLLVNEIERLNNIIKEVREYIKKNTNGGPIEDKRYFYSPEQANDILEILDKGSE